MLDGDLGDVPGGRPDAGRDRLPAGRGGVAAVHGLEHAPVLHADHAAHDGQRLKVAVVRLHTERRAVPGAVELFDQAQEGAVVLVAQAVCEQIVHQHADGVAGAPGLRGVPAPAFGQQAPDAGRELGDLHLPGARERPGLHGGLRLVGDDVRRDAAADVEDPAERPPGKDAAVVDAFLAVAEGEVGVRGEAEEGGGMVCQIIAHVAHAGLLVGAEQRAHGVAQGDLLLLQVLERVEAEDARPLVVHHAAADDPAVPLAHGEGILLPAVAHGHHVQMGNGGEIALPVATDGGVADAPGTVDGVQPQFAGDPQPQIQRLAGAAAEGRALLRRGFDAVDRHKAGDIAENGRRVLLGEGLDVPEKLFVHILCSFRFVPRWHQFTTRLRFFQAERDRASFFAGFLAFNRKMVYIVKEMVSSS